MKTIELKKNFFWTGVQDPNLEIFDIIIPTQYGTSYNAYLLKGSDKQILFETSKSEFTDEFLEKLSSLTDISSIDYLMVSHTEPDHSGSIERILELNPDITLVGSAMAMKMTANIVNRDFNKMPVKDGDTLSLGDKTLRFIPATNLHWPEVMFTYVEEDKILVTCDAFGCHYSFDDVLQSKVTDDDVYIEQTKYYYDCIMGPFKPFVLQAIDRIKDLDIELIANSHGPVLDSDPWRMIDLYKEWSTEKNPNTKKTVVMPYVTAYGHTKALAEAIAEGIKEAGDIEVKQYDMIAASPEKQAEVVEEMRWADGILLGTPTILQDALEPIWNLTIAMFPGTHGGKLASAFGSYGWSGEGVPNIMARLRQLKMKCFEEGCKVPFKPSDEELKEAKAFGKRFAEAL